MLYTRLSEVYVSFRLGVYDPTRPLFIDPTLTWDTFLGGASWDYGYGIAADGSKNVYLAGYSYGAWGSPVRADTASVDVFFAKLPPDKTYADTAGACGGNVPCYTTINGALNAVMDTGSVDVYAATYTENVSIGSGVKVTLLGATNLNGSLTIGSGTTFNSTANTFNLSGNWTNSGTFNHNNGTVRLNGTGGTQTISGNTTFYDLTLANSNTTTDFGTSSITIANTLSATNGTMNAGTSTITFTGAAGLITGSNAKRFYDLVINSGSSISNNSGGNLTIQRNFTNNGAFTQGSTLGTTFDATTATHDLSGSGATRFGNITINGSTAINAGSHNFSVSGNWSRTGAFTPGTSTVTFNGTSQTLTGNTTFNNLTTNAGTTLDTGTSLITVNGTLTNNGALKHTTPAQNVTNGGGTFSFVDAVNKTTAQLTQTGGSNMGDTTLVVTAHLMPPNYACGLTTLGGTPVCRLFNLTPTNTTGVTATLRLYFYDGAGGAGDEANGNTLSNSAIYYCDGTNWERWTDGISTGTDGTTGYKYVELTNVTAFSPFGIGGGTGSPTAITLRNFTARAEEDRTLLAMTLGAFGVAMLGALGIVIARRA